MPRYFIDIEDGDWHVEDREGIDLPNARTARLEAASLLAILLVQAVPPAEQIRLVATVRREDGTQIGRQMMAFSTNPAARRRLR